MKGLNRNYTLIVRTMAGLEEILAGELKQAGATGLEILNRAVKCQGDNQVMYAANYRCRCALRVLSVVKEFEAENETELYRGARNFPWENLIDAGNTIAVHAIVNQSRITHSHYAALKVKDAIADRFRKIENRRPSVDVENPDLRIQLHLHKSHATLLLDSSGDSLHKRGYRRIQGEAPLSEVLAAGMIMLAGWDGSSLLLDPMCGSGTILCEAAMIAKKIPPGYFRKSFGFMRWKDYDASLWDDIRRKANLEIQALSAPVVGSDVNQRTLFAASENIEAAGLTDDIILKQVAFEDSSPPSSNSGFIITNPPYGERIKKNDLHAFYKMIGDVLKNKYAGYSAWLITSDFDALKRVGLKPSQKLTLYNGPLECRYVKYDLYSGSRKHGGGAS